MPGSNRRLAVEEAPARAPAWSALRADLRRYIDKDLAVVGNLRALLSCEAVWLSVLYRAGCWIYHECPRPLAGLFKLLWKPADRIASTLLDTHLSPACNIGPGLYIGHYGGIWINPEATLGADCNIAQGVVIGMAGPRGRRRAPAIGNRVWIGPHSVITGGVRIGDEAVIGANALVVSDVPAKAVMIGVPAHPIGFFGSSQLIRSSAGGATAEEPVPQIGGQHAG